MFEKIWKDIVDFFSNNVWNIVLFVAVLVIGYIAIKVIVNLTRRIFKKSKMEGVTQGFIIAFLKIALYLALVLALLSIIGVQISGIITALSAVILAIGVALQNIIANVANGIVVVSMHMVKEGDYITVEDVSGSVKNINLLFTTIATSDNRCITIPNSMLINSEVINNDSYPIRRVDFTFSVAYESDVELVKKIVIEVMKSNGQVRLDGGKQPFCRLKNLGASSLDFAANCWCDSEDYWDVYYYVVENVYNEFKRNGISIPYNQLEIRERKDVVAMPIVAEPLAERVEKVREEEFDIENASFSEIIEEGKKKREQMKEKRKKKKNDAAKKGK